MIEIYRSHTSVSSMTNYELHKHKIYKETLVEDGANIKYHIETSVEFVTVMEIAYYIGFIVRNLVCVCLYWWIRQV